MLLTPRITEFWQEDEAVSSIEYALLASLIAVVCVVSITAVGTNTMLLYTHVCNLLATAIGGPSC